MLLVVVASNMPQCTAYQFPSPAPLPGTNISTAISTSLSTICAGLTCKSERAKISYEEVSYVVSKCQCFCNEWSYLVKCVNERYLAAEPVRTDHCSIYTRKRRKGGWWMVVRLVGDQGRRGKGERRRRKRNDKDLDL